MTDPQLRHHDHDGEARLLDAVRRPVERFLARTLDDRATAEDVASQTWLTLIERHRDGFRPDRPVAYAMRVAWSRAQDHFRSRATAELPDGLPQVPEEQDLTALRDWLEAGMNWLPTTDRALIHLRYVEDRGYREMAEIFDIPVGTVKSRLNLARRRLKENLTRGRDAKVTNLVFTLLPVLRDVSETALPPWSPERLVTRPGPSWALLASVAVPACLVVAFLLFFDLPMGRNEGPRETSSSGAGSGTEDAPVDRIAGRSFNAPGAVSSRGPVYAGRVVDARGRGLEGARVVAYGLRQAEVIDPRGPLPPGVFGTRADAEGRFSLPVAKDGSVRWTLVVWADGHRPRLERLILPDDGLVVPLSEQSPLRGRVLEMTGGGVFGADVAGEAWLGLVRFTARTTSGSGGRWTLALPALRRRPEGAPDRLGVRVTAKGFASTWSGLPAGEAPPESLDLYLQRGFTLRGRVRGPDGPMSDARVVILRAGSPYDLTGLDGRRVRHPHRHWIAAEVDCDAAGRYELPHVGGVNFNLLRSYWNRSPTAERQPIGGFFRVHVGVVVDGVLREITSVECKPGRTRPMTRDFELPDLTLLLGRVVDDTGSGVPGVEVRVVSGERLHAEVPDADDTPIPSGAKNPWTTTTDADGAYELALPVRFSGRALLKLVAVPNEVALRYDCPMVSARLREGDEEAEAPDLVLARPARVVVKVVDATGRAVPGASVSRSALLPGNVPDHGQRDETDRDGRVIFSYPRSLGEAGFQPEELHWGPRPEPKHGGPYRLYVRAPGMVPALTPAFEPGVERPPEVTAHLEAARTVTGHVLRGDETPARDVTVLAWASDEPERLQARDAVVRAYATGERQFLAAAIPDAEGRFELPDLPRRIVYVTVSDLRKHRRASGIHTVAKDQATLTVHLDRDAEPTGRLDIHVRDAGTGDPVSWAMVSLRPRNAPHRLRLEQPGHFTADGLAPGEWWVLTQAEGYTKKAVTVRVMPGSTRHRVDVRLEPGATVRGTLTRRGTDRPPTLILLRGVDELLNRTLGNVEPDGTFLVAGLPPGARFILGAVTEQITSRRGPLYVPAVNRVFRAPASGETLVVHPDLVPATKVYLHLAGSLDLHDGTPGSAMRRGLSKRTRVTVRSRAGTFTIGWPYERGRPLPIREPVFLAPGVYDVEIRPDGEKAQVRRVEVGTKGILTLQFAVP